MKIRCKTLFIFFLPSPLVLLSQQALTWKVVRVADGDTIAIPEDGNNRLGRGFMHYRGLTGHERYGD